MQLATQQIRASRFRWPEFLAGDVFRPSPNQQSQFLGIDAFVVGANLYVLMKHYDVAAVALLNVANSHLKRRRND